MTGCQVTSRGGGDVPPSCLSHDAHTSSPSLARTASAGSAAGTSGVMQFITCGARQCSFYYEYATWRMAFCHSTVSTLAFATPHSADVSSSTIKWCLRSTSTNAYDRILTPVGGARTCTMLVDRGTRPRTRARTSSNRALRNRRIHCPDDYRVARPHDLRSQTDDFGLVMHSNWRINNVNATYTYKEASIVHRRPAPKCPRHSAATSLPLSSPGAESRGPHSAQE